MEHLQLEVFQALVDFRRSLKNLRLEHFTFFLRRLCLPLHGLDFQRNTFDLVLDLLCLGYQIVSRCSSNRLTGHPLIQDIVLFIKSQVGLHQYL